MAALSTSPSRPVFINHRWHVTVAIITAGLLLFALWYVLTYSTTFPLAIDEWVGTLPRTIDLLNGKLTVYGVIRLSYDGNTTPGVTTFTWLLSLPNVLLFHWNLKLDSLLNYGLAIAEGLLAWHIVTRVQTPRVRLVLFAPIMALEVCIQQRWNLLVSFGSVIHIPVVLVLCTYLWLSKPKQNWRNLVLASIMAFVGTFATIAGPLIWGIALPALWFFGYRRWPFFAFWLLSGAVAVFLYIHVPDFGSVNGHYMLVTDQNILNRLLNYALFFLAYVGAVFNSGPDSNIAISFLLGSLGLIIYTLNSVHLYRQANNRPLLVASSSLAAYSLAYGVVTAVARTDQFGVRQGMESHYITFSTLFWCALLALVGQTFWQWWTKSKAPKPSSLIGANAFLLLLGLVCFVAGAYGTIQITQDHTVFVAAQEQCIIDVATGKINKPEGCDVVGGVALPDMIQALYNDHLTGFAP